MNILLFIFCYLVILISILGYGLFFIKILDKRLGEKNYGYVGLFGLLIVIIYSYLSNVLIAHSEIHNSLFIFLGVIFFIYKNPKKKLLQNKNEILLTIAIFLLLLSSLFIFKNHDDFPYYHFPYTHYLTQQSFVFGIGQLNHGFRTPSSIFYLNSLFFLPLAKSYLFNLGALYFFGFTNIILLKKIHNYFSTFEIKKQEINYLNYLSLLSFIFINIFFYRISEHGTDKSAQILIFLLIIELIFLSNIKKIKSLNLFYVYLLTAIIISLKAFFILYLVFILPLFFLIKSKKKNYIDTVIFLVLNRYFYLSLFLISLVFFTYFINTGCIIYPIKTTCFESLSWAIPITEVQQMNNWYELWSKGGATPNFRVKEPDEYIMHFNWVSNWTNIYFFNKITDFFSGLISLVLITLLFFKNNFFNMKTIKLDNHINIIYFLLFMLALEWFYNHPALRYGGYCIFALLIFIPVSLKLGSTKTDIKKYSNSIFILIGITVLIFNLRNVDRIIKEINFYNYKPFTKTYYLIAPGHYRIQNVINKNIKDYKICKKSVNECNLMNDKIHMKFNKYIFKNQ